jgi:hypothetical protein
MPVEQKRYGRIVETHNVCAEGRTGGGSPRTYGMPVEQKRYGRIVETHNVCVAAGSRSYFFLIRKDRKNI